jgi:hypothetical protein
MPVVGATAAHFTPALPWNKATLFIFQWEVKKPYTPGTKAPGKQPRLLSSF